MNKPASCPFLGLLLLIPVIAGSCVTTQSLSIEVVQPPSVPIPLELPEMLLVNHALYQEGEDTTDVSIYRVNNWIARECILGIMDGISQSPLTDTDQDNIPVAEAFRKGTGDRGFLDSLDRMDDLAVNYGRSGIMALEHISLVSFAEQEITTLEYDQDLAPRVQVTINQNLVTKALFRIYRVPDRMLLDEYMLEDTVLWYDRREISREMMLEASYWAGYRYISRIIPTWIRVDRFFYLGMPGDDRIASRAVKEDRWLDAATFWKPFTVHRNPSVAARACFNMALASEINDQVSLALEWASRSNELKLRKTTSAYIVILKKRLIDRQSIQ